MIVATSIPRALDWARLKWLICLSAVAAILTVAWITKRQLDYDEELTTHAVAKTNQARVQGFEQYVLRTLDAATLAAAHVEALVLSGRFDPGTLKTDPVIHSSVFSSVVVSRDGLAVQAGEPIPQAIINTLDRIQRAQASIEGPLIVAPPLEISATKRDVPAIRRFADGNGYVALFLPPARFTDFAKDIPFGHDDLISLIGLDGITRARRTGNTLSTGEHVAGLVMERQKAWPNGTYVGPSVLDGIPRIFSHRRLARFNLFATSGTPMTTVRDRTANRRIFQFAVMLSAIAAIALAAVLIIVAGNRRQRRLVDLEKANERLNEAQRIGAIGDWDYYPSTNELHWSEHLAAMYGRGPDERVSSLQDVAEYVNEADAAMIERKLHEVFRDGKLVNWETSAKFRDGSESFRRVVAAPIYSETGAIIGVHGTDQDITQEVQSRIVEKRLVEMARLESVNALAATLAHELNQPLGITANYLGASIATIEQGAPPAQVVGFLEMCQDELDNVAAILHGARDLVTSNGAKADKVNVHAALDSVMVLLRSVSRGRRAVYEFDVAHGASEIWVNEAQFKQVLFNLMKNGLEAVPPNREPILRAKVRKPNRRGVLNVEVTDNGAGIAGLTDPFATLATTKSSGLGLGLSLCRTIVEAHGGKIWIMATGDRGTTVAFTMSEDSPD